MASYNAYLQRALRSNTPSLQNTGKAVNKVGTYFDNLLGVSATKVRNQANLAQRIAKIDPVSPTNSRYAARLTSRANKLAAQSSTTRKKTALVGGLALAGTAVHKHLQNKAMYAGTGYDEYSYPSYSSPGY